MARGLWRDSTSLVAGAVIGIIHRDRYSQLNQHAALLGILNGFLRCSRVSVCTLCCAVGWLYVSLPSPNSIAAVVRYARDWDATNLSGPECNSAFWNILHNIQLEG